MNGITGKPPSDREIAALADGTLGAERRREIENQIAGSEQIRESIGEQRAAVDLARELDVPAPDRLRAQVAEMAAERAPRRRRSSVAIGGAVGAAAAVFIALVLVLGGGGASAPTVDQVVTASNAGPLMAAPGEDPATPGKLALGVGGVRFPYWEEDHGWKATGARSETVEGRKANTVFYENDSGGSLTYTIVDGSPIDTLADPGDYDLTGSGDTRRIVWRNGGHTCIIEASGASASDLEQMIV